MFAHLLQSTFVHLLISVLLDMCAHQSIFAHQSMSARLPMFVHQRMYALSMYARLVRPLVQPVLENKEVGSVEDVHLKV